MNPADRGDRKDGIMSLWDIIKNRFRSWTSTEYVLSVAYLATLFVLAWHCKLTTVYVAGAGPVMTFIWGRTRQKQNGNGR